MKNQKMTLKWIHIWTALCIFSMSVSSGFAQLFPNLGGQRVGISSYTFLKNDISPRAIGMGGAITTLKGDEYSSQWNPATLPETGNHSVAMATSIYPGGINHSFLAGNIKLTKNDYLSVNVNNLNSGQMEVRTEFQPYGTGEYFSVNDVALGVTYAKALTYRFNFGTTIKYINEKMDVYTANSVGVDLGFIYKTDFKNFRFGVFLQNFGPNSAAKGNHNTYSFVNRSFTPDNFSAPTVFKFGVSIVPYKNDYHSFTVAVELNNPGDNAANLRGGLEYSYLNFLFIRTGYWINIPGYTYPNAGLGFRKVLKNQLISINYAFSSSNTLGINHTIGLSITFNKAQQEVIESY